MDNFRKWLSAGRGRGAKLATELGITQGAISQWSQIPADKALDVERITGISRHDLRPDVFGSSKTEGAAA